MQGRLREAAALYDQALRAIEAQGEPRPGAASVVDVGVGELLCEWNELPASLQHLSEGLAAMRWWGKPDDLALANVALARAQQAQGNLGAAEEALNRATQAVQTHSTFPEARGAVEAAQVRLWLAQGHLAEALRWARADEPAPDGGPSLVWELQQIARARVFLAAGPQEEAIALLRPLAEAAEGCGRFGRLIEIRALEAVALHAQGHTPQALTALEQALALAKPEGYVRVFVDEGQPMAELLQELRRRRELAAPKVRGAGLGAYPDRLLVAFRTTATASSAPPIRSGSSVGSPSSLIEPLSQRELEVLRLMAAGLTNQEIAARLIIALGTVKAHTHNIFGKLSAQNRAHAIALAKELGLL